MMILVNDGFEFFYDKLSIVCYIKCRNKGKYSSDNNVKSRQ